MSSLTSRAFGFLRCLTAGAAFAVALGSAAPAFANCTVVAGSNASFGSVSSVVVKTVVQQTSSLNAGLTCQGAVLSILQTNDHFFATVTSAHGGLQGPTGDLVPYLVYGNSTTSFPIPFGVPFDYATSNLIVLLGMLGSQSANIPMYFRTSLGANVAAGTYTDTVTVSWQWNYCRGLGAFGICVLGRDIGTGSTTLQLTVVVTNVCQVSSSPDVSFGQAPVPAAFPTVQQGLSVLCTKGLAVYTVGLSAGLNTSAGRRRMAGGGQFLAYDLYKSGTPNVWGSSGSDRVSAGAAADGLTPQVYSYRAEVYASQSPPPTGTYVDTVIIDIIY